MDQPEGGFVARHTTMPPRRQRTPYGDVTLTSRWMRDHYQLRACGPMPAVRWLFPQSHKFEHHRALVRHTFEPAPTKVSVERELRVVCARWQSKWDERLQEHHEGTFEVAPQHPPPTTVGTLCDARLAHRRETIEHPTWLKESYYLRHWRSELGENTSLQSLTEALLKAAAKTLGERLKPETLNGSQSTFKSALAWARDQGFLHATPERALAKVKVHRDPTAVRWWTRAEVAFAITIAQKDHHQPTATLLVALGCLLGLRYEEIVMLRWQDVDLDALGPDGKPVPVCHIVPHDGWTPKDDEARTIPMPKQLHEILLEHRQPSGYILQPEPVKERAAPPPPRKENGVRTYRYDARSVWRRVMKAITKAGGTPIRIGAMRHTFASNLLVAGISDVKVSRWLGNANCDMVHAHYGHLLSYDDSINVGR